jgi:hypothetical protein
VGNLGALRRLRSLREENEDEREDEEEGDDESLSGRHDARWWESIGVVVGL